MSQMRGTPSDSLICHSLEDDHHLLVWAAVTRQILKEID